MRKAAAVGVSVMSFLAVALVFGLAPDRFSGVPDYLDLPVKAARDAAQDAVHSAVQAATDIAEAPDSPRLITWSMAALPKVQHQELAASGVAEGFETWERLNTGLDFERVDGRADIGVEWEVEPSPHHVGLAEYAYLYRGTITVHLGDYDCNGRYVQWSQGAVKDTAMHEIGHILGLGHVTDEAHLMYGDGFMPDEPQALSYVLPEPGEAGYFVGEELLHDRLDELDAELAELDARYAGTIERWGLTVEQYESGNYDISSSRFSREITPVIDEYNVVVDEYNAAVDAVNCYRPES